MGPQLQAPNLGGYPYCILGPRPVNLPTIIVLLPVLSTLCPPGQLVCISEWDLTSPPTEAIPDIPRLTWMASSLPHCFCAHLNQTTCLSTSPDGELPESKVFASPTFTTEPGLWPALNVYRMNGLRGGGNVSRRNCQELGGNQEERIL